MPADASIFLGVDASEAERLVRFMSREDVDFERDVRPWLGDRGAYFTMGSDAAYGMVFEAEDEDAAEALGRKVTAAGPLRASAIVDGRLVLASSRELLRAANAAAGGESLADSTRLDVAGEDEDGAPDILLATRDPSAFGRGVELLEFDALDLPALGDGPLTARVWREDDSERAEITGLPEQAAAPSLEDVPGAAWLAVASGDLSADDPLARARIVLQNLQRWPNLGLERVFRHLDAGTFFLQGRSRLDVGARLRAQAADERALRRAVVEFARGIPRGRWNVSINLGELIQLGVSRRNRLGPSFFLQVDHGRLFMDMGRRVGGVADDLGDTPRYRDAQRRLRGGSTLLIEDDEDGYLAARRDGGSLRVVDVRRAG